jgi:hypothetical protein
MVSEVPQELEGTDYYIELQAQGRNEDRFIILKTNAHDQGSITYHLNSATHLSEGSNRLDPQSRGPNIALSVSREHCPEKHGRVTARCLRDIAVGAELLWAYDLQPPNTSIDDVAAAKSVQPFQPHDQLRIVHMEEDTQLVPQHGHVLGAGTRQHNLTPVKAVTAAPALRAKLSHKTMQGARPEASSARVASEPPKTKKRERLICGLSPVGHGQSGKERPQKRPRDWSVSGSSSGASHDGDEGTLCQKCLSGAAIHAKFGKMLLCDKVMADGKCNAGFHLKCLPTPLSAVPTGSFLCPMHWDDSDMAPAIQGRSATPRRRGGVQRFDPLVDGRSDREIMMKELSPWQAAARG